MPLERSGIILMIIINMEARQKLQADNRREEGHSSGPREVFLVQHHLTLPVEWPTRAAIVPPSHLGTRVDLASKGGAGGLWWFEPLAPLNGVCHALLATT